MPVSALIFTVNGDRCACVGNSRTVPNAARPIRAERGTNDRAAIGRSRAALEECKRGQEPRCPINDPAAARARLRRERSGARRAEVEGASRRRERSSVRGERSRSATRRDFIAPLV